MRATWRTAWQGPEIVVYREDEVVDRVNAQHIERVVFVYHGSGDSPGELYLTDEDRAELGEARSGRAFTIDTTPPLPTIYGTGPEGWLNYGGTWYE